MSIIVVLSLYRARGHLSFELFRISTERTTSSIFRLLEDDLNLTLRADAPETNVHGIARLDAAGNITPNPRANPNESDHIRLITGHYYQYQLPVQVNLADPADPYLEIDDGNPNNSAEVRNRIRFLKESLKTSSFAYVSNESRSYLLPITSINDREVRVDWDSAGVDPNNLLANFWLIASTRTSTWSLNPVTQKLERRVNGALTHELGESIQQFQVNFTFADRAAVTQAQRDFPQPDQILSHWNDPSFLLPVAGGTCVPSATVSCCSDIARCPRMSDVNQVIPKIIIEREAANAKPLELSYGYQYLQDQNRYRFTSSKAISPAQHAISRQLVDSMGVNVDCSPNNLSSRCKPECQSVFNGPRNADGTLPANWEGYGKWFDASNPFGPNGYGQASNYCVCGTSESGNFGLPETIRNSIPTYQPAYPVEAANAISASNTANFRNRRTVACVQHFGNYGWASLHPAAWLMHSDCLQNRQSYITGALGEYQYDWNRLESLFEDYLANPDLDPLDQTDGDWRAKLGCRLHEDSCDAKFREAFTGNPTPQGANRRAIAQPIVEHCSCQVQGGLQRRAHACWLNYDSYGVPSDSDPSRRWMECSNTWTKGDWVADDPATPHREDQWLDHLGNPVANSRKKVFKAGGPGEMSLDDAARCQCFQEVYGTSDSDLNPANGDDGKGLYSGRTSDTHGHDFSYAYDFRVLDPQFPAGSVMGDFQRQPQAIYDPLHGNNRYQGFGSAVSRNVQVFYRSSGGTIQSRSVSCASLFDVKNFAVLSNPAGTLANNKSYSKQQKLQFYSQILPEYKPAQVLFPGDSTPTDIGGTGSVDYSTYCSPVVSDNYASASERAKIADARKIILFGSPTSTQTLPGFCGGPSGTTGQGAGGG